MFILETLGGIKFSPISSNFEVHIGLFQKIHTPLPPHIEEISGVKNLCTLGYLKRVGGRLLARRHAHRTKNGCLWTPKFPGGKGNYIQLFP